MKEETMLKIVNEINDALWDLKYNQCNVDTKEKGWETYYGLDDGLIKYIRKIEKELDQYKNIVEDIEKYIHSFKIEDIGEKTMLILNDILLIKNGLGKDVIKLNKMKELEEDKYD